MAKKSSKSDSILVYNTTAYFAVTDNSQVA